MGKIGFGGENFPHLEEGGGKVFPHLAPATSRGPIDFVSRPVNLVMVMKGKKRFSIGHETAKFFNLFFMESTQLIELGRFTSVPGSGELF